MKTTTLYQRISILLALICIGALFFFKTDNRVLDETKIRQSISSQLEHLNQDATNFFDQQADSIFQANNPWQIVLKNDLVNSGWELFMLELDELVCWSSNEFEIDSAFLQLEEGQLVHSDFGWNFVQAKKYETSTLLAVYPLLRKGTAVVKEINRLPASPVLSYDLGKASEAKVVELDSLLIVPGSSKGLGTWQFVFIIGFLIAFTSVFVNFLQEENKAIIVLPVLLLVLRILAYKGLIVSGIESYELFNPGVYASSFLLPSLGDLLLHSIVAFAFALAIFSTLKHVELSIKRLVQIPALVLCAVFSIFLADMQFGLVEGLVIDSNISYDVLNLQTINIYSILAILLIGLNACSWFLLSKSLLGSLKFKEIPWLQWIGVLMISILLFYTFQHLDAKRTFDSLFQGMLLFLIAMLWLRKWDLYKWKQILFLTFTISVLASISIRHFDQLRDREHLNFHASKLVSEKDLEAEYQFEKIETKLVEEFLNPGHFDELNENKDDFEKRLRHLYFSSSLNQYELKLLSFHADKKSVDTFSSFEYDFLDQLYNDAYPTISKYFYQIKKPSEINGYIAKFENCDQNGHYGNVYLLLEPKVIQSTYVYPPLLKKKSRRQFFSLSDYSFAIYNKGDLIKQKGEVAYDLKYDESKLKKGNRIFGDYSHFISHQSESTTVVLSTHNSSGLKLLSTLSFSFLFYCICILVILLLFMLLRLGLPYLLSKNTHKKLSIQNEFSSLLNLLGLGQKLLSVRIQLIMASLIFAGLLASVFFTIKYLELNHNQRSAEDLSLKINEVVNQLQNEPNLEQKLLGEESVILLTAEVSDIHKVEANIFNSQGLLLASSKPEIYTKSLFSTRMDPQAFYQMNVEQVSQLIHRENLRGFDYLSAYLPLFNEKHRIIGYANLPYFIGQTKLNEEISTYTITFVNLYLLLFALALALAYIVSKRITKPLKIIQEKISTTALGTQNETIEWKGSDEIGQLIKQYNKMVLELEASANRLTESEREGAWKEMARQVAHEIKNPLTPMKLNIQHLQRAWKDDHPKLEETFKKVTRVLIDQIESLSRLASEFSSFAQMPSDKFENYNIHQLLLDTLSLFERSENVKFIYDKQLTEWQVHGDKEQVGRAFNNLIKNAIQAIPEDRSGVIVVEAEKKNKDIEITIKDNGVGIAKDVGEQIFVPRFSTKNSGMGLGLAITKKIIENNGGTVSFTSELGKGTIFTIKIPLIG